MQQVALLSSSLSCGLSADIETSLARAVEAAGGQVETMRWLCEGAAVEAALSYPVSLAYLRHHFSGIEADINLVPSQHRRKQLLIADMDSTIITSESLNDLASLAGKGDAVADITARSMRGELDFTESLIERVRMLAGQPAQLINTIINDAVCNRGAEALIATMHHHGARCVLASGGFTFLTEVIANRLGFDEHHANTLEVEGDYLAGTVAQPVLDQHAKLTILEARIAELGLTTQAVATIGDGANDRGMTAAAGMGVAYRGKPALKDTTTLWLDHTDLDGLLWLQGYDEAQIIRPG